MKRVKKRVGKKKGIAAWPESTRIRFKLQNPKLPGNSAFERYENYKHSKTIGEALQAGAFPNDLKFDLDRKFLQKVTASKKGGVAYVVSLGTRCMVADSLKALGLRRFSGPFDWMYTSTEMINQILKNGFKEFLDLKLVVKSGKKFGHKIYGPMLNRGVVYPHEDPRADHGAKPLRRVERFRAVVSGSAPILFAHCNVIESRPALEFARSDEGRKGVRDLFQTLCNTVQAKFELLVVQVVCGRVSEAKGEDEPIFRRAGGECTKQERGTLSCHELHCIGTCTGLQLKSKTDEHKLRDILKGTRHFDLQNDPLVENAETARPSNSKSSESKSAKKRPASQTSECPKTPSRILHPKKTVRRGADGKWRPKHMD